MGTVTVATSIVNSVETSAVPFSTSDIETRGVAALASSLVARPRDLMRSDIVIIDEETTIEAASMTLLRVSDSEIRRRARSSSPTACSSASSLRVALRMPLCSADLIRVRASLKH